MISTINFNHLYYFYMVVRHETISATSRFLHVSQPSLSTQIRTFEESLGVNLFDRRGNKLELTPVGKIIYSKAAQMFEVSASISEVLSQSSHQALPIHIGIADEIERPFAVNLVRNLTRSWGKKDPPRISFTTGLNENLIEKLRGWTVDAVITNRPSLFEDLETAGTLVLPVYFAVAAHSGMRGKNAVVCGQRDIIKIMNAIDKGLSVPYSRLKLREEIDEFLVSDKAAHPITFESDTLATVIRAIIDNIGVGFLPIAYVLKEVTKGEVVLLGPRDGLWDHTLFLMIKRGRGEAHGVQEVIQAFDDLKKEILLESSKIYFGSGIDVYLKNLKDQ